MIRKTTILFVLAFMLASASSFLTTTVHAQSKNCWGQAAAVYARLGKMGPHSSQQENPRVGLYNLAVALYDDGVLDEPTLQALGAFVADLEGLSIEACM